MQLHSTSKKSYNIKNFNQCGVAFVEAMISIPILIVFSYALIDLGAWLMRHYEASRIVYEIARTGAGTPDLLAAPDSADKVEGCLTETNLRGALELACAKYKDLNHCTMHTRAKALLDNQLKYNRFKYTRVHLMTCYSPDLKYVEARIRIPWSLRQSPTKSGFNSFGWLYNWRIWPDITASARAPYLFN